VLQSITPEKVLIRERRARLSFRNNFNILQ
jgi:hypothetical protein